MIALYVFYHGNNLAVFGITKGAREEDLNNRGTKRPDEIDPTLVDPTLIEGVKKQEELKEEEMNYLEMMREAMIQSQKETYKLHQTGNITNSIFDHTPDSVMEDYEEDGVIDLDFFNDLNGF